MYQLFCVNAPEPLKTLLNVVTSELLMVNTLFADNVPVLLKAIGLLPIMPTLFVIVNVLPTVTVDANPDSMLPPFMLSEPVPNALLAVPTSNVPFSTVMLPL